MSDQWLVISDQWETWVLKNRSYGSYKTYFLGKEVL